MIAPEPQKPVKRKETAFLTIYSYLFLAMLVMYCLPKPNIAKHYPPPPTIWYCLTSYDGRGTLHFFLTV